MLLFRPTLNIGFVWNNNLIRAGVQLKRWTTQGQAKVKRRLTPACSFGSEPRALKFGKGFGSMELIKKNFLPIIVLVAAIWIVEAVNLFLGHGLTSWGILPRRASGLIGIPMAPFLHAGLWHAISNTVPLLILGGLTLIGGKTRFWANTVGIVLLSGVLVWLFARGVSHVGASGLVLGYFGALLARAYFERGFVSIAVACVTMILYGGMLWGILPLRSYISFEGHLFGLIAGIAVAWLGQKLKPRTGDTKAS